MKTARQAGWTVATMGDGFVSVSDDCGNYAEFYYDNDKGIYMPGKHNDVHLFDLPLSVIQLIRFWLGTITADEYQTTIRGI